MKLSWLFPISAIYLALVGLGTLISPTTMMAGALVPASLVLIDTFRGFAGAFLGVAILDWLARKAEASQARDAIVLGNLVGYVFAAVFGILAVLHGYPMYGWALVVIDVLLAVGFFIAGMSSMSAPIPAVPSTEVKARTGGRKSAAKRKK